MLKHWLLFASCMALACCERAGADFENRSSGPIRISSQLLPQYANGMLNPGIVIRSGQFMPSVWYLSEHRWLMVNLSDGRTISLSGSGLRKLAEACPHHCIIRVSDGGLTPIKTDIFGKPEN